MVQQQLAMDTPPTKGMPLVLVNGAFEPYWKENLPQEEYLADKGALSSGGIRAANKSAAQFFQYWTGEKDEPTNAMNFGTLAHKAILEPKDFMSQYVVKPEFWGKTKKGEPTNSMASHDVRDQHDVWMMEQSKHGKIITTEEEILHLGGMARGIAGHDDARLCLTNGKPELSGWFKDKETGLILRFRPDFLNFAGTTLVDLKTTRDCSKAFFQREIVNRGYHIQLAMYAAGCEAVTGVKVKYPTLIAIEKKPPYEVAVYILDDGFMQLGEAAYRKGLRTVAKGIETGKWPKAQERAENISPPAYAFYTDDEEINEIGA